ncbi:MAG TPA: hypothetical protein VJT49_20020 [Amycolatopsis sp.]|uniref:hypothetical protein n=1 Tax=Amycolatopsis sp. TaxID=37632 RepID=UPI002B47EA8F|nr:hypothetical protein [Amycolatopsis sp.]HKS47353.1 hypothetical protein [Amycolatopsis sp.]
MVRTVTCGGSGDLVRAVQLADRTGIVAASAPPAVSAVAPGGPDIAPRFRGEGLRAVRRNVLFTCSAALFLVVGWIGGGTFGHHDVEQTPAVAAGVVTDKDQAQPVNPPVAGTTRQPPKPASGPPSAPKQRAGKPDGGATRTSQTPETTSSTPTSAAPGPRADLLENTAALQPPLTGLAQFRQLVNAWMSGQSYPDSHYGSLPPYPVFPGR